MKGTLYGIGVGPGDPDLMTLKAVKACREANVIALPQAELDKCFAYRIALEAVPELADKATIAIPMPMTKDPALLERSHAEGAEKIAALLLQGKTVAFLTLGDPSIYSTYYYIHTRVEKLGFKAIVIPGITSFSAAAAALGIPLCLNSEQLHIIPGTYGVSEALPCPGTKVFMKNDIAEVRRELEKRGKETYMAENCSTQSEHLYREIADFPEKAGYYTLFITKD